MDRLDQQFLLNGRWLFDVASSTLTDLRHPSEKSVLKSVAARILSLMISSPDTLMRRRQLLDDGWRQFGFEVCENALNQVIHTLRVSFEALGPGHPVIKTIPRIGYCLLARVEPVAAQARPQAAPVAYSSDAIAPAPRAGILLSRSEFDDLIAQEWRRIKDGTFLSLLLIGLDNGAYINSPLLRNSAWTERVPKLVIQNLHRSGDRVADYDALTIAALLPCTGSIGVLQVASRIAQAIRASALPIRVKLGLASTQTTKADTFEALVQVSRATMHELSRSSTCLAECDFI
jgi:DNA-binding winged helix-turn-helix (wHTH) protein/GGDEF domain-containing protein